eukprot:scaffold541_cov138-Cylindrotheca_fusiformis.AAC.16
MTSLYPSVKIGIANAHSTAASGSRIWNAPFRFVGTHSDSCRHAIGNSNPNFGRDSWVLTTLLDECLLPIGREAMIGRKRMTLSSEDFLLILHMTQHTSSEGCCEQRADDKGSLRRNSTNPTSALRPYLENQPRPHVFTLLRSGSSTPIAKSKGGGKKLHAHLHCQTHQTRCIFPRIDLLILSSYLWYCRAVNATEKVETELFSPSGMPLENDGKFKPSKSTLDARDDDQPSIDDVSSSTTEPKAKKKRSRGRRRKAKGRNKVEPTHKKQPTSKKQHDAPMKKRDLYFSLTCATVAIKGGSSVVARVTIVNWDLEMVLDTFVHVPVPVVDFKDSGVSPKDIQKSRSNTKAKSFSEVRQMVEQILRGKILIGHQLSEHLTALGLSHPSTDVRDTSVFFKTFDLRGLCQKILKRDIAGQDSMDLSLESCTAVLDLYKTYRKEWEQDLIQRAQQSQPQSFRPVTTGSHPSASPHYNAYHMQEPQRLRFPSYENTHAVTHGYAHTMQVPRAPMPQHYDGSSSWYVRGNMNMAVPAQPAATPVLSSRAMQALYPPSPGDDIYDNGSSLSCDGSALYESSNDYNGSLLDAASVVSDTVATASVASWQEDDTPSQTPSSSSWFRFGSKKTDASNPESSPHHRRRMSAVSEEQESEIAAAAATGSEEWQDPQRLPNGYEPPRYFSNDSEESSKQSSSWFAFRLTKSPGAVKKEKVIDAEDELNNSRSHASPDLKQLGLEKASSEDSTPSDDTTQPPSEDGDPPAKGDEATEMEPTGEKSSSWFSFRRSKSPSASGLKQVGITGSAKVMPEQQADSTYSDDEDWLREVMDDKPSGKAEASGLEESSSSGSSSKLFRFLRTPKQPRSRLPSLDGDNEMETALEEDAEAWIGQAMHNNNSELGDGWDGLPPAVAPGGLFFSPARSRFPTESTIQSVASEEDEGSFSQDLMFGMEQNLAFLNI